jgi:hypothetical protein
MSEVRRVAHFSGTIHLDQSLEQNLWKNSKLALLHML